MNVVFYGQKSPDTVMKSIFLAGPSPRDWQTQSWRPEAIRILEDLGYDGVVYVPENRFDSPPGGYFPYEDNVAWEELHLNRADQIVFWVPRDKYKLLGLTTNHELGRWEASGKVCLGFPVTAVNMRYQNTYAEKEGIPVFNDLRATLAEAVKRIGDGAPRTGGERDVPLHIWTRPEFQAWYLAQVNAGNRLDEARVLWAFRVGKDKSRCFMWTIYVKVWIASEQRWKSNEILLQRPDIFAVVAYLPGQTNGDDYGYTREDDLQEARDKFLNTEVVLVREFRSPAKTEDCFIRELPGGSVINGTLSDGDKAAEEFEEETGLTISADRLNIVGTRQICGTLCTHSAHVVSVQLTAEEMLQLKYQKDTPHGIEADTERTFVEIHTVRELLENPGLDWGNLGMIMGALARGGF